MNDSDRAELIAAKFLAISDLFGFACEAWNLANYVLRASTGLSLPTYYKQISTTSTVPALEAMNELEKLVGSVDRGQAIFAHLIVPHSPYVVSRACSYLPWSSWVNRPGWDTLDARRRNYDEQVRCVTRKIGSLLAALAASPAGADSIVIIHGDHGSRLVRTIPEESSVGRFSDADMIAGFAALFAIRAPAIEAGYFTEPHAMPALLHDFADSDFRKAPHPKPPGVPFVYLANENWHPARTFPLPQLWARLGGRSDMGQTELVVSHRVSR